MPQVIPALVSYGIQAATAASLGAVGSGIAGAIAGGLVASMLQPTQKSQGPRLGDLQVQSSSYGTVIPFVLGSPRLAGQVIWASEKREIATVTESGGKGGGGQEHTSYTYKVDLLLLLTSNEQPGIDRVWMNGGLIWNKSSTADSATVAASDNIAQWGSVTVYDGNPDQLPDPIYEAAVGAGNAPAYRGRLTVMLQDVDLGSSGQIPNFTFEIRDTVLTIETTPEAFVGAVNNPQVVVLSAQYAICVYANGSSGARAGLIDISGANPVIVHSTSITGVSTNIGNLVRITDTQALWLSFESGDLRAKARIVGHIGTTTVTGAATMFPVGMDPSLSGDSITSLSEAESTKYLLTWLNSTYVMAAAVITVNGWTAPVIGAMNTSSPNPDAIGNLFGVALSSSSGLVAMGTGVGINDLRTAPLTISGDTVTFGALSDIIDTVGAPLSIAKLSGSTALVIYSKFTGTPSVSYMRSLVATSTGGSTATTTDNGYVAVSHSITDTGAVFAAIREQSTSKMFTRRLTTDGSPVAALTEISAATTNSADVSAFRTGTGAVVVYSRNNNVYVRILTGN